MGEGTISSPIQSSQENIETGNSIGHFSQADIAWFMWRVLGVVLMTPIVFFALIFIPDQCFASCRISYNIVDRPETWPEVFLWFIVSLALSIYFFFYTKKKGARTQ